MESTDNESLLSRSAMSQGQGKGQPNKPRAGSSSSGERQLSRSGSLIKPIPGSPIGDDDDLESGPIEPDVGCCDPRKWWFRWMMLVFISFLGFGSYFVYDIPAALESDIEHAMNVNVAQYSLLYALYSWPNVILCFFGGFLIDRVLGVAWGSILFAGFVLLGQAVVAIGAQSNLFWLMLAGRFIFGIGGESLAVAQNNYVVRWFKGKELNMVFGIQLSFSRVGSTVNLNIMKPVFDSFSNITPAYSQLGAAMWFAALFCGLSLSCAVILLFLERRTDRVIKRDVGGSDEKVNLKDVKDFPLSLWLLFIICVGYYVGVFPFIGLALVFFESKYSVDSATSHALTSIVYIISAAASPVFGLLVDRTGRNLTWVIAATAVTVGCHVMMAFTFINPYVPIIIMGFAYSVLACALWPIVSLVVPEHQLGTAYGFMQSVQNLGLAVVAQGAGILVNSNGYLWLEIFFSICVALSVLASILLWLVDDASGGKLNASAKTRKREAAEKERAALIAAAPPSPSSSPSMGNRMRPRTPVELRNRFLTRLGIEKPVNLRSLPLAQPSLLR
ncbi:hypothetical protein CAOG_01085 [Capsaspora owczarzaki ATCC 30864]|uniref:Lysosomal dipeptide transporter MFSD1 n=1 Tax=Capsaspora owczarzaki (strain ATCC 30864) TaxID=595528 RepID=A0A0D2WJR9_CAPO3|nr:hypothetical protein CAOG_01085 [Capsaspora owczarzaki ATCC 30864]KJE89648.1 hypothetical protein CAOG_001085 [Capsaspora owczarzaki ATCC 30864]|eukprot:XP_004365956.2 hypothetical protein CAOG_01085 [Capsaspora owczarzaki ATCC 30864]